MDNKKEILYYILSYIIPFIIIIIALVGLHITPFGDNTLVISDANGLYINTLSYAGRMFRGLEGPIYSFEKGLGGNMMGHLNGILLVPFGFLFALTNIVDFPIAFTLVSTLNLSLSGLTMYILLSNIYHFSRSNLIFSTSYALMGFSVANVFQAVFYSAAPVVPIMVLGLKKLFEGKTPLPYILSLAYSLIMNFYFGFVLCIASVLFFLVGLWYNASHINTKKLIIRYMVTSICGGFLACVLWLPSFMSLIGGRLNQTDITDFSFWENMPFLQIGAKLFSGANSTSELVNGLPNIFVGILPVALVVLFFLNKDIDNRKKIAACILLGFYLLSFWIVAFNMLMHGGTTTNWFNYRYSYIFSFIILIISAEMWQRIETVPVRDIKNCLIILIVSIIIIFSQKYEFIKAGDVLLDFAILSFILAALRVRVARPDTNSKRLFEILTLFIVSINLFVNYRTSINNIMDWDMILSEYRDTVSRVDPLVQTIKESDNGFYRMEVNRQRSGTTGNDPMLYGYDGVGHGGSNERNFVREGLNRLGIPWFDMRNYYADGIPSATDSLLGVKYVIAEEDLTEEKGYQKLTEIDDWNIYLNPNAMPVAMLSVDDLSEVNTDFENDFENLNNVWAALSGLQSEVFIEENDIDFITHNLSDSKEINADTARQIVKENDESLSNALADSTSIDAKSETATESETNATQGRALKSPPENQSYIEYSWVAKRTGRYYSYNRSGLMDNGGSNSPVLCYEGYYNEGDTVRGYLPVPDTYVSEYLLNEVAGRFRVARADEEALFSACKAVVTHPVTLEKMKDDHLVGEYTSDAGRQLLFTIPWDEGWTCYVDGAKTDIYKVFDVFMAVDVPEGTHSIEMRYVPSGLRIGIAVSICALIVTLAYIIVGTRKDIWGKVLREEAA